MYTKKFIIQFGKYLRSNNYDPEYAFEKFEVIYAEPYVNFPYEELQKITCDHFNVDVDEFQSSFKYGNLPMVRKIVCYLLDQFGMKNKHIAALTGFSPSYISGALRIIRLRPPLDIDHIINQIKQLNNEKGNYHNHFCIDC